MILGLVGNPTKKALAQVLPAYVEWLDKKQISYILSREFNSIPGFSDRTRISPEEVAQKADVLLSFGGDGTLLNTVNLLRGREIPVLGINLGGLGYLTEVGTGELYPRTIDLLEGRWKTENRMLLEARLENGSPGGPWYALNDIVVDKGGFARMIHLRTSIDGQYLNNYRADGLILSTPTGSTAYSLSAGGPILEPGMNAMCLLPINPHSLSNRPLVISDQSTVHIEAHTSYDHIMINIDGEIASQPPSGSKVEIRKARFSAQLVSFEGRYFYDVLRQKLGWGDIR